MDIGTPRFFIDAPSFGHTVGMLTTTYPDAYFLNLAKGFQENIDSNNEYTQLSGQAIIDWVRLTSGINYIAVLGHKFNDNSDKISFNFKSVAIDNNGSEYGNQQYISNGIYPLTTYNATPIWDDTSGWGGADQFRPAHSGSSIVRTTDEMNGDTPISFFSGFDQSWQTDVERDVVNEYARKFWWRFHQRSSHAVDFRIGGLSFGWTYTMPHSADLNLTYSLEYDGYDVTKTKGGATLTNARWFKPDYDGGRANIWDRHTHAGHNLKESPSGRRVWNLSFSYLARKDVHGTNLAGNIDYFYGSEMMYLYGDPDGDLGDLANQYAGIKHDFYNRVIHGTLGGALPFIFQPDSTRDEYAICRFDQQSFQFKQILPDVWNISLKIVESW